MTKLSVRAVACIALLWSGAAVAEATPQEQCDGARIAAWGKYLSCVDVVVARDARGVFGFDSIYWFRPFAKCRHAYFENWAVFQSNTSLATSTCICNRLTDNGDGTVTDNLTGLMWEKKTMDSSVHDVRNKYTWSMGSPYAGDGTAFTGCLGTVNGGGGFGGANDWRLPTLAELQTIVLDFACTGPGAPGASSTCQCGSTPCIDWMFGPTQSSDYWSATNYVPSLYGAAGVNFWVGAANSYNKGLNYCVRAVRNSW